MKLFQPCYDLALRWSKHPAASRYLALLSFAESVIFPIPPDVMLAPMSLSQPSRAWYFALITTLASIVGGVAANQRFRAKSDSIKKDSQINFFFQPIILFFAFIILHYI